MLLAALTNREHHRHHPTGQGEKEAARPGTQDQRFHATARSGRGYSELGGDGGEEGAQALHHVRGLCVTNDPMKPSEAKRPQALFRRFLLPHGRKAAH